MAATAVEFGERIARNTYLQGVQRTHEGQLEKIISEMPVEGKYKEQINQALVNKSPMR